MSKRRSDEDEEFIAWLTSECRRLEAEREKFKAERDRLIEACVVDKFKPETYHIGDAHWGFEWRYGDKSGFFNERKHAIEAVRKAAGIKREATQ